MNDIEIQKFAVDLHKGLIFTSRQVRESEQDLLLSIFMPLIFMKPDVSKKFFKDAELLYEYYSKASPRSVNDYPTFFSCGKVTKEEWLKIHKVYLELVNAERKVLGQVPLGGDMKPVPQCPYDELAAAWDHGGKKWTAPVFCSSAAVELFDSAINRIGHRNDRMLLELAMALACGESS